MRKILEDMCKDDKGNDPFLSVMLLLLLRVYLSASPWSVAWKSIKEKCSHSNDMFKARMCAERLVINHRLKWWLIVKLVGQSASFLCYKILLTVMAEISWNSWKNFIFFLPPWQVSFWNQSIEHQVVGMLAYVSLGTNSSDWRVQTVWMKKRDKIWCKKRLLQYHPLYSLWTWPSSLSAV